jgi:hypothetical protein
MQYRAPSDRSPFERWLLLAAFAVSCMQAANSGNGTEGGITSPSDAATPSSGGSTASGSVGSNSGGSGGGSSSGGSTGEGTGSGGSVSSSSGRSVTAGDAGTNDAGNEGTEAGGEGGLPAGCAGKTYRLCEDFESGSVGAIPPGWQLLQGYSTRGGVGLANDEFHSGGMSLKSESINPGQDRVEKSLAALG